VTLLSRAIAAFVALPVFGARWEAYRAATPRRLL
jgi:hypothetical protein